MECKVITFTVETPVYTGGTELCTSSIEGSQTVTWDVHCFLSLVEFGFHPSDPLPGNPYHPKSLSHSTLGSERGREEGQEPQPRQVSSR